MTYDEFMTTLHSRRRLSTMRSRDTGLHASRRRCLVKEWLKDPGDTISNAASDASNKRARFDAVADEVESK